MLVGSLQVKNVAEPLHEQVRKRAAERSMTVGDYVLDVVRRDLSRPTLDAWLDRVHHESPTDLRPDDVVAVIHEGREEREAELMRRAARIGE